MTTKEIIDSFFSVQYEFLKGVAIRNLRPLQKQQHWQELLSDSYIYALKAESGIAQRKELEPFLVSFISQQCKWHNSEFRKKLRGHNDLDIDIVEKFIPDKEETIELFEKQGLQEDKLAHIYNRLSVLPTTQQILFDLMFNQGVNSSGKLRQYYQDQIPMKPPSRANCWRQMTELKALLLSGYSGQTEVCIA